MVEGNQKYKAILLFGIPGSRQGDPGGDPQRVAQPDPRLDGQHLRKIPRNGRFGREIEHYTTQGLMVPDDLTVRIFQRHLMIMEMQELLMPEVHSLILDGLPRTYAQAERLNGILDVIQIFHLKINDTKQTMDRLRARA